MDVVFVHPHTRYDSYDDYKRLVQVTGFEACYPEEIDKTRTAVYIISPFNGEYAGLRDLGPRQCRIVHWNMERPDSTPGRTVPDVVTQALNAGCDAVWMSDRAMARQDPRVQYVIFGSDRRLAVEPASGDTFDVCHLSYVWGRRTVFQRALRHRGITIAPEAWTPEAKAHQLLTSKVLYNVHQYTPLRPYTPIRFALAAAYACPVVSETTDDIFPLLEGENILTAAFPNIHGVNDACPLVERVEEKVHRVDARLGQALQHALCVDFPFGKEVRAAAERVMEG